MKKNKVSYEDLKKAFMDIAEVENAYDMAENTGLPLDRCGRILEIYDLLVAEKNKEVNDDEKTQKDEH